MDIPIYLITGFLESGKTSFVKETLSDPEFTEGCRTLLIAFEEGIEEYEDSFLKESKIDYVLIEEEEEITENFFIECHKKYNPQRVMIEYNGVWNMDHIFQAKLPKEWALAQIISLVDASVFRLQMSNMRSMLVEQLSESDLIIFNRCDDTTDKLWIRRNIKVINRKAQIIYERADGQIDEGQDEELPYDINQDEIDIVDDDYGIWYMDAMDYPERYDGKTIRIRGMVYKGKSFPKGYFVPGRFAMTCCEDDMQFVGFVCKSEYADRYQNKEWVYVTAEMKYEYNKAYGQKGIVLYLKKIEHTSAPDEELVYFT